MITLIIQLIRLIKQNYNEYTHVTINNYKTPKPVVKNQILYC